ncbi:uncharacterized protein FMAN_06268 [Fusarium mangiferae]|uniref:Uncharacterized protein n=1 Tax=Fusarium mangiferae TaxID=192010 RepID=A0A1L7SIU8_FUSMA|nr:uncharacterized protein FMAN_06268 [Fusarium mangiferae]CVK86461.1 uncharacterized protein FMAN_06268 [Fusarium mangiferae]
MATDSTNHADVPKEQSIPDDKTTPEAAEHSSAEVNNNKNDRTVDVKKNRRKVWVEHYDKLSNTTPDEFLAKNPHLKGIPTTMKLPSEAHEYMGKVKDDDLAYLDHYCDDAKLSEHDLLELGARGMFP